MIDVWHAEHDPGDDCVVCELQNEPQAEASVDLEVALVDATKSAMRFAFAAWVPADPVAQVPARAPPLS